jgi:ABC-type sugar transport system ATPase subunit
MSRQPAALEMRGISKAFAGNSVLANVDLTVEAGKVHALVGENGAGKSTLMKILAGVYHPDSGTILMEDRPVHFVRPADALKAGIAMIFQELSLAPHLTVAENIFLGREPLTLRPIGLIDSKRLNERAEALLREYGFRLNVRSPVSRLSAADRQLVEITRAIVEARRVIVMDEPTSSLTTSEVDELFRLIRDLEGSRTGRDLYLAQAGGARRHRRSLVLFFVMARLFTRDGLG